MAGHYINGFRVSKAVKDLSGQKFSRLRVIELHGIREGAAYWKCRCGCEEGNEILVATESLKSGNTKSCGCLRKETIASISYKHGKSETYEFVTWRRVLGRCLNKNNAGYADYGGRGIQVCKRYRNDFMSFLEDLGECPLMKRASGRREYSIDRVDNNSGYFCGKCEECIRNGWKFNLRWANNKEQARNRRNNKKVFYKGQTKTLVEWVEELGLPYHQIKKRLGTFKWSVEKSFETLLIKNEIKYFSYEGKTMSLGQWAKEKGLKSSLVHARIRSGWSFEHAITIPKRNKKK